MTAVHSRRSTGPSPDDLGRAIRAAIDGEVRTDDYSRHLYASDASMYAIEPLAVVYPRHAEDVAAVVASAAAFDVPVLARGAGTSLAGQTVNRAVVLDFSRHMNRVLEIDSEQRVARVEPGVVQEQLNRAAAGSGLMFGPDTSTSNRATIGGMIGNNSAGSHSVRYGSTIDHVLSVETVLSDATRATFTPGTDRPDAAGLQGRIYRDLPGIITAQQDALASFPPYWRHSGGYRLDRAIADGRLDVAKLLVGSEGTLALVTAATVGLVPLPAAAAIAVGLFDSVESAVTATDIALAANAASVELIDHTIIRLSRERVDYAGLHALLDGDPAALLVVEFFGDTMAEAAADVDALADAWAARGDTSRTVRATTPERQAAVLKVRRAGLGLLMAAGTGTRRPLAFVEDTAVPPQSLAAYVRDFKEILDRHGMTTGFYGHCSVGCLHIRPFVDLRIPAEATAMRAVAEEVAGLAARYGGVNSSEHGDGLARSEFNRAVFGDDLYGAMQDIKRLFDESGRFNPGKIVDAPPMTDHLRDPELPEPVLLPTIQRFAEPGGMWGAADRCMNIGACRKQGTGVMCPSYMVTGDEEHSTRGRANALVKALSAPDPQAALAGDRLHDILDLCVGCKACKSECPLGVDMAALKNEALFHYYEAHGIPRRARALGRIRQLNRLGSAFAPISNLLLRSAPVRTILDRALGISRHRPLPQLRHDNLASWFAKRSPAPGAAPKGDIILLADSFTTFSEPAIGKATVDLLERAGWRVRLTKNQCCGRASISNGLLPAARDMAARMLDVLVPDVQHPIPIVGVEPSCLLTLRDDYARLLPDDVRVPIVHEQARLAQHYILEAIKTGDIELAADSPVSNRRILFHGHCHEKAIVGTEASTALLWQIPGAVVEEADAGCCGMAGSFGFESEHYETSMDIGRLRLFPAIESESTDTILAATGASCRQQIEHGTGRVPRHPIELIHAAARQSSLSAPS